MSVELMNLLVTILAPVCSSILTVLVTFFLARIIKKLKEDHKVDDKDIDTINKVSAKVLKNSPVTVNTDKLIELIEEAEAHQNFTSFEKLDFVLTSYQQYCIDNNFKYVKEFIAEAINKLIDFTKEVNKREKDVLVKETVEENQVVEVTDEQVKGIY